jgi:hypothetical protein
MTKAISGRRARPITRWPKWPQSHLRLFAGQRAQAQIGLRLRARPMAGDDVAEVARAAAIAALAHHGVQAAGGQRRELLQHLADERQIGVDLRWPLRRADARQAGLRQHPGDHVSGCTRNCRAMVPMRHFSTW